VGARGTVIVLGIDTPIGLAIVRDLGRHGYDVAGIGRTATALASSSRYCTHCYVRRQGVGLIEQIREIAAKHSAKWLLSISEVDLLLLNRYRSDLERDLQLLVPRDEQLSIVLDKEACLEVAGEVGIATPRSVQIESLQELAGIEDRLSFPVVLKWSDPNGVAPLLRDASVELEKAEYAASKEELSRMLSKYASLGVFPLIQEYCPGTGLGQMFLTLNGDVLVEFQHERVLEWPPEGGSSAICRSVPLERHAQLRTRSRDLLRRLNWTGVAMVEYRFDRATESYVFMEINGRFWGSLPLAIAAGVPFAAGLVETAGQGESPPPFVRNYPEITCCYWIPATKSVLRVLFQASAIRDPLYELDRGGAVRSYLSVLFNPRTTFYVFCWSDPRPFFTDVGNVLRKIIGLATGRLRESPLRAPRSPGGSA
jgi:predicted ATP-grasp superfamily ATP-dependent carboligase